MQRQNRFPGTLLLVLICGLTYSIQSTPQDRRSKSAKSGKATAQKVDPFLDPASGPITLPKLLDLLQRIKEDIETEGRVLRAISIRGFSSPLTPESVEQINAAGGSPKLLDLLREKAPPPPPMPEKKEEPTGSLTLQCGPAECEISVQGGKSISTKEGSVTISGLKLGEVVVDYKKPGYFSQQRKATVKSPQDAPVMVELEPGNNTQLEFGKRLFKAMMDALGGEETMQKDSASFAGSGSATFFDTGGSGTEWNLTLMFYPNKATLDIKNSGGAIKLECQGEACQLQPGSKLLGKRVKPGGAQNLETALRQFRKYHLPAILNRMSSTKTRLLAKTGSVPASADQHLQIEASSETYDVLLNPQLLPAVITFTSKTGLGSGLSIGFADYTELGATRYPRTTEIKLPEGKQGLRVHLDQLTSQTGPK
jgi:hypothetical protein